MPWSGAHRWRRARGSLSSSSLSSPSVAILLSAGDPQGRASLARLVAQRITLISSPMLLRHDEYQGAWWTTKDLSERSFACRARIAQKVDLNHFLPLVLSFRLANQPDQQICAGSPRCDPIRSICNDTSCTREVHVVRSARRRRAQFIQEQRDDQDSAIHVTLRRRCRRNGSSCPSSTSAPILVFPGFHTRSG